MDSNEVLTAKISAMEKSVDKLSEKFDGFVDSLEAKFVMRREFNAVTKGLSVLATALWLIGLVISLLK